MSKESKTLQEAVEYLNDVLGSMYEWEIDLVATQDEIEAIWTMAVKASDILEGDED